MADRPLTPGVRRRLPPASRPVAAARRLLPALQLALATALVAWLVLRGAAGMGYNWQWYRVPPYLARMIDGELIWGPLALGLVETVRISAASLVLALLAGLAAALLRLSEAPVGRAVATGYVELIRNTPLLVQLYIGYFVLAPVLGLDRWWTGVLCLALFEGAFAAEIFRAGIAAVPPGQSEAAASLGLGGWDTQRYVVLPQALRLMLPPLANLAVSLVKHSAIVSVIAVVELTTEARNIISDTYLSFEIWFTVAGLYLLLTASLSAAAGRLERRVARQG